MTRWEGFLLLNDVSEVFKIGLAVAFGDGDASTTGSWFSPIGEVEIGQGLAERP